MTVTIGFWIFPLVFTIVMLMMYIVERGRSSSKDNAFLAIVAFCISALAWLIYFIILAFNGYVQMK